MPVYNEQDKTKWTKDKRHWYFRCTYEDINGNKKRYKSKMFLSQSEARDAESKFLLKVRSNDSTEDIMMNKLIDEFLFYKRRSLKSSTYYGLETYINRHIRPTFDDKKLSQIKTSTINAWLDYIESNNFNIRYMNKLIGICKEIMTYAKNNYIINPKLITLLQPVKDESPIENQKLTNFWTYDEWLKFIEKVGDEYYNLIFTFFYFTGMRFGEVAALTWRDIDFKNKTISVTKTLTSKVGSKSYIITSPKTKNSVRKVEIPERLLKRLEEHLNEEKRLYHFSKDMFVFGNIKPLALTTLRSHLDWYIKMIGVKRITPHGFRHSHVSLLVHLGCDFRDIAERIGDTITMVQNTYYHMYPEEKSKVVELLNKL